MLKQQIQNSINESLKSGERFLVGTLRMLLASIITKEKEKRYKISKEKPDATEQNLIKDSELTDEQIVEVIFSEIKKRNDAVALYERGNRQELAEIEKKEIEILKTYLPEQLSEQELKKLIQESVAKVVGKVPKLAEGEPGSRPQSGLGNMGKIMADLMPKVKGRADNSEISKIVKEMLAK